MGATSPNSLWSSQNFKTYAKSAVLGAAVDLTASDQLGGNSRAIYCEQAGDLVVTKLDGTNETLPFVAGVTMMIIVKGLVAAGSTAKGIVVFG